jgi:HAMP domain-containing protein
MARVPVLTSLHHRVRRRTVARLLRRTAVVRRLLAVSAPVRRAWRRSLQLRMVTITLVVSTLLVGVFGVVVASQITEGLVHDAVSKAHDKLVAGQENVVSPQLRGITDRSDPGLNNTVGQVLNQLAANPAQGPDVIVALKPIGTDLKFVKAQSVPEVPLDALIKPDLESRIAESKVAHEFVTANLGNGPRPYLVYGTPVPVPAGTFALYYVVPLDAEADAADLVRNTVIATGTALVLLLALITALITRLVVRPVRTAARTAQRFSLGLFDQRMEVRGEDDLAMLAASFNQMAENLQGQIARLEEMSRLQRRFTSDVSHELRTPLTTVRMAADLIYSAREDFEPAVARSAELFQAELDRFEELLTDLLEISRFDAGFAVLDAEAAVGLRRGRRAAAAGVAGRAGDRRDRSASGGADPAQPDGQRGRARGGARGGGTAGDQRHGGRRDGAGPRRRAGTGRGEVGLQPVLAGGFVAHPADRRHRTGPVDQPRGCPAARRLAGGVGRAGVRCAVPADPAGAGGGPVDPFASEPGAG